MGIMPDDMKGDFVAKNDDIRQALIFYGIEWDELSQNLHMRPKEFVRLMNKTTLSPLLRRRVKDSIKRISSRAEGYYYFGDD